jgi:hypothetical protein
MAHCYNSPSITRKGMKRVFAPVPNYFGGSMKKISAVLLVLVLVGSVVFAGFTGSATTSFGYDLDSGEYGFDNSKAVSVDVNFVELLGEAKSEGDVYVDIKATLDFNFNNADDSDVEVLDPTDPTWTLTNDGDADFVTPLITSLKFHHAKIVGDDWYVGILGTLFAPNFATSVIDSKDFASDANSLGFDVDDATVYADVRARDFVSRNAKGVEFGYAGYVVSLGFTGDTSADKYNLFGTLGTPAYEFGDGLTGQFGASGLISETDKAASLSAKVDYANDDLAVGVATDIILDGNDFLLDAAVAAKYDVYSLDVYFATDAYRGPYDGADIENLLSVKVAAVIDPVTVTVTGKDLVNTQDLGASVKFQATDELAVTGRGGYKLSDKSWNGGADVAYIAKDFTAKLGGTYRSSERISLNASVESDTIIPGAVLKLAYAGDDLTETDAKVYDNGDKGSVKASVKIAF